MEMAYIDTTTDVATSVIALSDVVLTVVVYDSFEKEAYMI